MIQQKLGLNLSTTRTSKAVLHDEMNLVVPWTELLSLIASHAQRAKTGHAPFELATMLRFHLLQQWFGLSDLVREKALFETALYREFANVNDVTQADKLIHGAETDIFADAGYQGVAKREKIKGIDVNWHVAMRPGKRRTLDKDSPMGAILDRLEHVKARIRAKVEHPFGSSNASSVTRRCATGGLPRTPRSCTHCSRSPICEWCAAGFCRYCRNECICRRPKDRPQGRNALV